MFKGKKGFADDMPNIQSAVKRVKTSEIRRVKNKSVRSNLLSTAKKFLQAVASGDKASAQTAYRAFSSALDKASKKNIIKKNNADRKKSRAFKKLTGM